MKFEDICWVEALFEKMMKDAQKARTKEEIIAIIRDRHEIIKEQKVSVANGMLKEC